VCIEADHGQSAPPGVTNTVVIAPGDPPEPEAAYLAKSARPPAGPCPLISDTARADPAGDD
jgi:hypothetical protein